VKKTFVSVDEEISQRERPGFISVERYGSIPPEINEIGAIVTLVRNPRFEHGLWVEDCEFSERIFRK